MGGTAPHTPLHKKDRYAALKSRIAYAQASRLPIFIFDGFSNYNKKYSFVNYIITQNVMLQNNILDFILGISRTPHISKRLGSRNLIKTNPKYYFATLHFVLHKILQKNILCNI